MQVTYKELKATFTRILKKHQFSDSDAELVATIFADSTLDGYHSHGVNRFAEFLKTVTDGYVQLDVKPKKLLTLGNLERWDAGLGPGPLNAHFAMERAISIAKEYGMACVALQNSSHWMRGGSYGWQAANAGCVGICFTNTEPNMPSWGAIEANTGNNPLIIAVPNEGGHIVLDMSMSQFSYGKLWKFDMEGKDLPFPGGFNKSGDLTSVPKEIVETRRVLPTGYWKGSGLSIMLDLIVTLLSSGRSTSKIGEMEVEYGLSQVFICFDASKLNNQDTHQALIEEIIQFVKSAKPIKEGDDIHYPGSQTLQRRKKSMNDGIEVNDKIWNELQTLLTS
jgi:3-dehydro-L-gulonate 2-dehydrogenase